MQSFKLFLTGLFLFVPALVFAGNLDSPEALDNAGSAMYTVDDIYNRLNAGTAGTKRTTTFTEPATGPGSTMHTLDDIMAMTPEVADTTGAVAADVLTGKTFWGLTSGAWKTQTGTATAGSNVNGGEGDITFTITDGLYSGSKTATANDADLVAGNIKDTVEIFGVTGTYTGAYPALVPKTGQTKCYKTSDSSEVTCSDGECAGQDGKLAKGVEQTSNRFTDNTDGTVTDNLTGLIWLKNANCAGTVTWPAALTYCNALADGTCSLTDGSSAGNWRLPNIKELQSLINFAYFSPALSDTQGTTQWSESDLFAGVQSNEYWSSTTHANFPGSAWCVSMFDGNANHKIKGNVYYVWPVRGGQ